MYMCSRNWFYSCLIEVATVNEIADNRGVHRNVEVTYLAWLFQDHSRSMGQALSVL